ncbi:sulfurtransferase [Paramicrobacterium agarici]|uniref:Thiosulfate/3-mercaptopyruvate sulfurtransferase n=1 Tax=Paramicrobacterium agarici TaxID=630514 RepID=A0A2A9DW76_9MICO|nr:sulfurtransferase [Microbacterium agarici]PFG30834.1 thiosulfate/3-mercaptopyruvate sulfurtransferase [Microbacterium agarici]
MTSALVTPRQLRGMLEGSSTVRLLDVRWRLDSPHGRAEYEREHLPGAVYVDLDTDLAALGKPATEGRHPLPDIAALQETARRLGICYGDTVIAYDAWNNMGAARAWWLLGWAGIRDVRVVNGGIAAWQAAGLPVESGDVVPARGDVDLMPGSRPTLTMDEAAALADDGVLTDSRAEERFRGETEPLDPRAGHIPGAANVPAASYLRDGIFADADELAHVFREIGVEPGVEVGTYCGSGVTAAHTALALHEIGVTASLFPGSWSQWSNHSDRPVATGR